MDKQIIENALINCFVAKPRNVFEKDLRTLTLNLSNRDIQIEDLIKAIDSIAEKAYTAGKLGLPFNEWFYCKFCSTVKHVNDKHAIEYCDDCLDKCLEDEAKERCYFCNAYSTGYSVVKRDGVEGSWPTCNDHAV